MIPNSDTKVGTTSIAKSTSKRGLYRRAVLGVLAKMKVGRLDLRLPEGEVVHFGDGDSEPVAIHVHDDQFFKNCVLYGNVGLGEGYVDGDWDTPDLRGVLTWFIDNIADDSHHRNSSQRIRSVGWLRAINRVGHWLRPNSVRTSRRNIAEHYDLGNEFYQLWLDPTMTYSAAKFSDASQSLESAQEAKYDALCRKLQLSPGDRVLEIGCGWGGFSLHAAQRYGCKVTALTISEAQCGEAKRRVTAAGLDAQIEIRLQDYRETTGSFDKIASIEMVEAVGHRYHEAFFSKCDELLNRNGLLGVQMITVPDSEYQDLRRGTDWIQKHIFPGSLLLSIGRVEEVLGRSGDLFMHHMEDLGASYARTLREWRDRFNGRLDQVKELGFDDTFVRKWNYYLSYCEAAFATRNISVVQGIYTRPGNPNLHREDGVSQ